MAMTNRGNLRLELQPDWEIVEAEDGSLRATQVFVGDRSYANSAPRLSERLIGVAQQLYCYERRTAYTKNRMVRIQCDYIGIDRDPSPRKVEFPGGSGTEPIESHPNFAFIAGTPANPRNGAYFNPETSAFEGFYGGTNKQGVRSYIVPDVRVNLNYFTFRTPQAKRITKEISYNLAGVVTNPTVLNYLLIGLVYRQIGRLYQVTEQWLGSGPRGWDRQIY